MRMHIPPTYSSNRHAPAQVVAGMRLRKRRLTKPAAETTTAEAKGAGEAAEDTEQEEQARPSTLLSVLAEAAGVMQAR